MDEVLKIVEKIKKEYPDLEDDGSKQILLDLVRREKALQDKMEIFKHPLIKGFVRKLKKELEECDVKLTTDREMSQEERGSIFNKKDLIKEQLDYFGADFEKQLESLIKEAKGHFKKLRTQ